MKNGLLVLTLLFNCALCFARPPVRYLQVGELVAVGPNAPVQKLSDALKKDKKSVQFRVSWSDFSSMDSSKATVLYDRKAHSLKTYVSSSQRISDAPEKYESKQESYLYRGVNDEMIHRLAFKNRNTTQYSGGEVFFSQLAQLGAKRKRLSYKVNYQTP